MSIVDKIENEEYKSKITKNLEDTDKLIAYIRQKGLPKSIEDRKIKEVTLNHFLALRDYKLSFWIENFKRNMKALAQALRGNNSAQWQMSFAQSGMFDGVRPKYSAFAPDMLTFLKKHHKEITGAGLVIHEVEGDFKRTFPTARVNAKLVAKDILSLTGYDAVAKMMYEIIQEAEKDPYAWYKMTLGKRIL